MAAKSLMGKRWKGPLSGRELSDDMLERLPDSSGIYLWCRSLRPEPDAIMSEDNFLGWLLKSLNSPYVKASDLKLTSLKDGVKSSSIRDDFIKIKDFEIGSGALTAKKVEDLSSLVNSTIKRREIYNILHEASIKFSPVLYVGQASSIKERIGKHLEGGSQLKSRLNNVGIGVEDTILYYVLLEGTSKNERELLEQFLTHYLVAPMSIRAG